MIHPSEAAGYTDYQHLATRMGHDLLERRILKQAGLWAREVHQGRGLFKLEGLVPMDDVILFLLKIAGLAETGRKNFLDVRILENAVFLPAMPAAAYAASATGGVMSANTP